MYVPSGALYCTKGYMYTSSKAAQNFGKTILMLLNASPVCYSAWRRNKTRMKWGKCRVSHSSSVAYPRRGTVSTICCTATPSFWLYSPFFALQNAIYIALLFIISQYTDNGYHPFIGTYAHYWDALLLLTDCLLSHGHAAELPHTRPVYS